MPSPLIAGLNPFSSPWMPGLALPPSAIGPDGQRSPDEELDEGSAEPRPCPSEGQLGPAVAGQSEEDLPDVQHLLVEMGDLVCKLQQRRELSLTSQEVAPEELLTRLAHFREVARAGSMELFRPD